MLYRHISQFLVPLLVFAAPFVYWARSSNASCPELEPYGTACLAITEVCAGGNVGCTERTQQDSLDGTFGCKSTKQKTDCVNGGSGTKAPCYVTSNCIWNGSACVPGMTHHYFDSVIKVSVPCG